MQGVGFACLTSVPSFAAPENPLSGPELLEELIKPRGPRWPHDLNLANQNTGSGMVLLPKLGQ